MEKSRKGVFLGFDGQKNYRKNLRVFWKKEEIFAEKEFGEILKIEVRFYKNNYRRHKYFNKDLKEVWKEFKRNM